MVNKLPRELPPTIANDDSVVHASDANVALPGNSRGHKERDISRLQSTLHEHSDTKTYKVGDIVIVTTSGVEKLYRCEVDVLISDVGPITASGWKEVTATPDLPLSTKGDLLTRSNSVTVKLGVGSNGKVLKADSSATAGLSWQDETSGAESLNELTDVTISTPTENQSLVKSAGNWINSFLSNAHIATGAAIAYSKLNLLGKIKNSDISSAVADKIAYAKLNLSSKIQNSDLVSEVFEKITGLGVQTQDLDMGTESVPNKIQHVDTPTESADGSNKSYVDTKKTEADAHADTVADEAQTFAEAHADTEFAKLNKLTTEGDLLTRNATEYVKLAKGTEGEVLKSTATGIEWGDESSGGEILPYDITKEYPKGTAAVFLDTIAQFTNVDIPANEVYDPEKWVPVNVHQTRLLSYITSEFLTASFVKVSGDSATKTVVLEYQDLKNFKVGDFIIRVEIFSSGDIVRIKSIDTNTNTLVIEAQTDAIFNNYNSQTGGARGFINLNQLLLTNKIQGIILNDKNQSIIVNFEHTDPIRFDPADFEDFDFSLTKYVDGVNTDRTNYTNFETIQYVANGSKLYRSSTGYISGNSGNTFFENKLSVNYIIPEIIDDSVIPQGFQEYPIFSISPDGEFVLSYSSTGGRRLSRFSIPYDITSLDIITNTSYTNGVLSIELAQNNIIYQLQDNGRLYKYSFSLSDTGAITETIQQSVLITTQDNSPKKFQFLNNYSKLFVLGTQHNKLYEYDLSTPGDLSTITFVDSVDLPNPTDVVDFAFSPSGQNLAVLYSNGDVKGYHLPLSLSSERQIVVSRAFPDTVTVLPFGEQKENVFFEDYLPLVDVKRTTSSKISSLTDPHFIEIIAIHNKTDVDTQYNRLKHVAPPIFPNDAANKEYVDIENNKLDAKIEEKTLEDLTDTDIATKELLQIIAYQKERKIFKISQDDELSGITVTPDGVTPQRIFIIGQRNKAIYSFTVPTVNDIDSAVYEHTYQIPDNISSVRGLTFNSSGSKMYHCGFDDTDLKYKVFSYDLSNARDISNVTPDQSENFNVGEISDLQFSENDFQIFILSVDNRSIHSFTLATAGDIRSTKTNVTSYSFASETDTPVSFYIPPGGLRFYLTSTDIGDHFILSYTFSISYDVDNLSYDNKKLSLGFQYPYGVAFWNTGAILLVLNDGTNSIYSFTLAIPGDIVSEIAEEWKNSFLNSDLIENYSISTDKIRKGAVTPDKVAQGNFPSITGIGIQEEDIVLKSDNTTTVKNVKTPVANTDAVPKEYADALYTQAASLVSTIDKLEEKGQLLGRDVDADNNPVYVPITKPTIDNQVLKSKESATGGMVWGSGSGTNVLPYDSESSYSNGDLASWYGRLVQRANKDILYTDGYKSEDWDVLNEHETKLYSAITVKYPQTDTIFQAAYDSNHILSFEPIPTDPIISDGDYIAGVSLENVPLKVLYYGVNGDFAAVGSTIENTEKYLGYSGKFYRLNEIEIIEPIQGVILNDKDHTDQNYHATPISVSPQLPLHFSAESLKQKFDINTLDEITYHNPNLGKLTKIQYSIDGKYLYASSKANNKFYQSSLPTPYNLGTEIPIQFDLYNLNDDSLFYVVDAGDAVWISRVGFFRRLSLATPYDFGSIEQPSNQIIFTTDDGETEFSDMQVSNTENFVYLLGKNTFKLYKFAISFGEDDIITATFLESTLFHDIGTKQYFPTKFQFLNDYKNLFGLIPEIGFKLDDNNKIPLGITAYNDKFYIADNDTTKRIFIYNSLGVYESNFELASTNTNPFGITGYNDKLYVLDYNGKIFIYDLVGNPLSNFELASTNTNPFGIVSHNNKLYVADFSDKVFVYNIDGTKIPTEDFPIVASAEGITVYNNKFYITSVSDNKVHVYSIAGTPLSIENFTLDSENIDPEGITIYNNKFYVVDASKDKVFVYNITTEFGSFQLHQNNADSTGMTYHDGKFYNCDYATRKVFIYDVLGNYESDFALENTNLNPSGIVEYNSELYITDHTSKKVYVYDLAGTFQRVISIHADNDFPYEITHYNNKFYILNSGNTRQVFIYDNSFNYENRFTLDSTNDSPSGITAKDGYLYVSDGSADKVFVYNIDGSAQLPLGTHLPDADFLLNSANSHSAGITWYNNKLYVSDFESDRVYIYGFSAHLTEKRFIEYTLPSGDLPMIQFDEESANDLPVNGTIGFAFSPSAVQLILIGDTETFVEYSLPNSLTHDVQLVISRNNPDIISQILNAQIKESIFFEDNLHLANLSRMQIPGFTNTQNPYFIKVTDVHEKTDVNIQYRRLKQVKDPIFPNDAANKQWTETGVQKLKTILEELIAQKTQIKVTTIIIPSDTPVPNKKTPLTRIISPDTTVIAFTLPLGKRYWVTYNVLGEWIANTQSDHGQAYAFTRMAIRSFADTILHGRDYQVINRTLSPVILQTFSGQAILDTTLPGATGEFELRVLSSDSERDDGVTELTILGDINGVESNIRYMELG